METINWLHNFKWSEDVFASSYTYPLAGAVFYIFVLILIKNGTSQEYRSKNFEIVHNAFLAALSFFMLVTVIYGAVLRAKDDGAFGLICTQRSFETMWDGPIGAATYIFYLSKFYEFIDTFVMALRQKDTIFLHTWHHANMPFTCWTWFAFNFFEGAWWCVLVNSFIHTMMYSYYLATVLGIKVWFKKYITSAQIVQFMSGTAMCVTWYYFKINDYGCTSDYPAFYWSNFVNLSFLGLFIKFYLDNYSKTKQKKN
eukprot:m.10311 g.10311  ORF g.10311 m.10311 type:complete len:255 (-) comp8242_c0_seq1:53-817(-)